MNTAIVKRRAGRASDLSLTCPLCGERRVDVGTDKGFFACGAGHKIKRSLWRDGRLRVQSTVCWVSEKGHYLIDKRTFDVQPGDLLTIGKSYEAGDEGAECKVMLDSIKSCMRLEFVGTNEHLAQNLYLVIEGFKSPGPTLGGVTYWQSVAIA